MNKFNPESEAQIDTLCALVFICSAVAFAAGCLVTYLILK